MNSQSAVAPAGRLYELQLPNSVKFYDATPVMKKQEILLLLLLVVVL